MSTKTFYNRIVSGEGEPRIRGRHKINGKVVCVQLGKQQQKNRVEEEEELPYPAHVDHRPNVCELNNLIKNSALLLYKKKKIQAKF